MLTIKFNFYYDYQYAYPKTIIGQFHLTLLIGILDI